MRIAVLGGGPGGLYFAALAKQLDPRHDITVWERNAADDTFGFGVVFSDETLGGIEHADTAVYDAMSREFARWDDIDVHRLNGQGLNGQGLNGQGPNGQGPNGQGPNEQGQETVFTSGGHGFAAMSRKRLLAILQERCAGLGVRLLFRTQAPDPATLAASHDLVVAADGANSATRAKYASSFCPDLEKRRCRYIWLGTDLVLNAFKFYVLDTPDGIMQVHGYPYSREASTIILEMHEDVWRRAGGEELSLQRTGVICRDILDGHRLYGNNSKWTTFTTVRCVNWRHENVVLLGDAAHTAHFSIGSGTKLAMEDALALAACLSEQPGVPAGLAAYEAERRPVVASTQRAAQASLEWFENIAQYSGQDPHQFAFNIMTRSRRVTHDNLRLRDPEFAANMDLWFEREVSLSPPGGISLSPPGGDPPVTPRLGGSRSPQTPSTPASRGGPASAAPPSPPSPPMFQPFWVGGLRLVNRVVVSAMDMYSAVDGVPGDFHLVHLGSKALGGAGLVMTEMVCVSPTGRITPGCAGIYTAGQEAAWRRITEFVHASSQAKIGIQLGHSGRKGSTRLMWEGIDQPLPDGNWEVCGPSPIPYAASNQVPHELTAADLAEIKEQFVACARAAARAGFDLLEVHCAHGYLLSSFLSPLTNQRDDDYGGSLAGRLRYPLEVFDAVRAAWPAERPVTVRISATDWCPGGIDADDAVEIARAFAEHGAAGIDVSTGQVVSEERPAYGRSYQTPYADRIRNEIGTKYGVAVIAVGAISSYDDVNSIILAGRADLCALGRTHLYDPQWTLHAAAEQEYSGPGVSWPDPFAAGRRRPAAGRTDEPRPRLELIRSGPARTAHARWEPGRDEPGQQPGREP